MVNNGTHAMPIMQKITWSCPELGAKDFESMDSLIGWVHKQELWNQPYNPFSDERLEYVTLQKVCNFAGKDIVLAEYMERVL